MPSYRPETVLGTLAMPLLLAVLTVGPGLDAVGWVVGLAAGWGATALLTRGRARHGQPVLPPDRSPCPVAAGAAAAGRVADL